MSEQNCRSRGTTLWQAEVPKGPARKAHRTLLWTPLPKQKRGAAASEFCATACQTLVPRGRFRTARAQRGHSANHSVVYPGNTPENHPYWPSFGMAYGNPRFSELGKVLTKVALERSCMVLCSPDWGAHGGNEYWRTLLRAEGCMINSKQHRGCRIQDPGTRGKHQTKKQNPWCTSRGVVGCRTQDLGIRGYRWWKTADFSHSARTARAQCTARPPSPFVPSIPSHSRIRPLLTTATPFA